MTRSADLFAPVNPEVWLFLGIVAVLVVAFAMPP